jgi:quercetin dioxygenase-like cupin family protein
MKEQEWPEELDALRAAPRHHALLFENENVRILDTNIVPGDTVPLHTHRWPSAMYILSFSSFVRCDAAGNVLLDSRNIQMLPEGSALWSEPLAPHTLQNVGERDLHVISVEVKSPA